MKRIYPSPRFKKDYKRYKHNPEKLAALAEIIDLLREGKPIPAENYPHPLHGNSKGCFECHVGSDFLLIWIDKKNDVIELVRLGSHSELFG